MCALFAKFTRNAPRVITHFVKWIPSKYITKLVALLCSMLRGARPHLAHVGAPATSAAAHGSKGSSGDSTPEQPQDTVDLVLSGNSSALPRVKSMALALAVKRQERGTWDVEDEDELPSRDTLMCCDSPCQVRPPPSPFLAHIYGNCMSSCQERICHRSLATSTTDTFCISFAQCWAW